MEGALVGVSNMPCTGQSCPGEICSRAKKPAMRFGWVQGVAFGKAQPEFMRNRYSVDCGGKVGRYVFVQLPGKDRILLANVTVGRYQPSAQHDWDQFMCYGVRAAAGTEAEPEYRTTDDPEDPMFYSTCLVREQDLAFLSPEQIDAPGSLQTPYTCSTVSPFDLIYGLVAGVM